MTQLDQVLSSIDKDLDNALERLFALLRIESISTDPAYAAECARAADLLVEDLASIGFSARTIPTTGHPMVVGHHEGPAEGPHILFYGHYDVQPVDPLELWDHPPFEPRIGDGPEGKQIEARGACDDKGQLMTFVEACRAWQRETGSLPCRISVLFEGEEESGSPSLPGFLAEHGEEIKADMVMVCDTGMWDRQTPAISVALRGMAGLQVNVYAANRDLHSGMYGSAAANPIHVLAKILGDLHDDGGRVMLDGFYDDVAEVPEETLQAWRRLDFSEEQFLGEIGLSVPAGERGRSVLEQIWSRPTCEINGVSGGYTGDGMKTVIPAEAFAKITCRLVANQDPHKVIESIKAFVNARLPADCRVEFIDGGAGPALQLDPEMPALKTAAAALADEWGKEPAMVAVGGSIPIVGDFKRTLGMDSLLVGFGLDDDRVHSPNEKYDLASFHRGTRSWARILAGLASG